MARQSRFPRYQRPDERILDDVWHRISVAAVDSQDVEVEVGQGVVTLSGASRRASRSGSSRTSPTASSG